MPPVYGFVLPVATEGGAALHWCLGHFRKAFPDAPLTVISDGVQGLGYDKICKRFNAKYVSGRYLKRIECGGQWWRRVLEEGVKTGADWIIKFDPDTKFHRAFRTPPAGGDIAGTVDHKDLPDENVLGGCQAIRRGSCGEYSPQRDPRRPRAHGPPNLRDR